MLSSWGYLALAIFTEVMGTLTMNASGHSGNPWMYGLMYLSICASYVFLSFALKQISVGIAIAIWEGAGTSLITLISILFLHEPVSLQKLAGIFLAVAGTICLHFGEDSHPDLEKKLE